MPELPEVETIRLGLKPDLVGIRIKSVSTRWPRHIVRPSITTFRKRIRGRQITDVRRRGKYIVIELDRGALIIHLMMSGGLSVAPGDSPRTRFEHTLFNLEGGRQLRFSDSRKFGRVFLLDDPQVLFDELGPEPLDESFGPTDLATIMKSRSRLLKPMLLDQRVLAGMGNIYTDEALHLAKLHPLRLSDTLAADEVRALYRGIRTALNQGLTHSGASIDWLYRDGEFQNHFRVYGREGEACFECGTPIVRLVIGQRGTHVCPNCQPEGGR